MEIEANKISKKSLFKLLFLGLGVSLVVFCIFCGIAAFFGASMITINEVNRYGLEGLIYGIILGPIFALVFSSIAWCFMAFGLWIVSFFKPLRLTFKVNNSAQESGT